LQLFELGRAGALQPLEQHHLAVDYIDARLEQAGKRELAAQLGAGTCRVGDDERLEALTLKIDRRATARF
jgi:hypothetical protein